MGCVGMSLEDFERCTPFEFAAIYKQWNERDVRRYRDGWEYVRTLAALIKIEFTGRKTAYDLLPFPWDGEDGTKKSNAVPKGGSSPEAFRKIVEKRRLAEDDGTSLVSQDNVLDEGAGKENHHAERNDQQDPGYRGRAEDVPRSLG